MKTITTIADIIPAGGDWKCVAAPGDITRRVIWGRIEVAIINPRGDLGDSSEANVAMGITAMPTACMALRLIRERAPAGSEIHRIAQLAIDKIEEAAPALVENMQRTPAPRADGRRK